MSTAARAFKAHPFAPDLAVEVASPTQSRPMKKAKTACYLAGGTSLVWVIWPKRQRVVVWHPGDVELAVLGADDRLDGESVVPGFTYPVRGLFS